MTESDTKSSSHASLKEKIPSQSEDENSGENMSSESAGNELKEGGGQTADDVMAGQVPIAEQKNTEDAMEVTEESKEKGSDNTTDENNEASTGGSESGNQNDVSADIKSENSDLDGKDTEENNENSTITDVPKPEVVNNSDTDGATNDAAEVAVVDGNASEQPKELSNEDASGDIAQKVETTEEVKEVSPDDKNNLESSKSNENNAVNETKEDADDKNGEEQVANDIGDVEDPKVDDETKNNDEEKHTVEKDHEDIDNQNDIKLAATTPNDEDAPSEENEKKDECHREAVDEGKNDDNDAVEENKNTEQDSKEDEIGAGDIDNGGDEGHTETLVETSIEERGEKENSGNDEGLVEKQTENSSADLITTDTDEKDARDSLENTVAAADEEAQEKASQKDETVPQENEGEIASGPEANLEDSPSQVSRQEDNKSEVPSENIDDLVDEILADTDDVDVGKKSDGSETNANTDKPEVTDDGLKKADGDDKPVITSECSEKLDEDGETGKQVEGTSSIDVDVNDAKDINQAEQTEQRAASGNTAYRVQTDYLTRQVIAKQEKEMYLEEKLNETTRDLEVAERKVKDLQLRLKRFVKDDEAKDQKMRQMEREYKELTDQMQRIEDSLHSKNTNNNIAEVKTEEKQRKKSSSRVCVIL
ncbi:uncharacterized protein DDB_G0290685-like isoform X2 [Dendronephthya gigantea]|nr:uncharacterized protein DDB_G0290685-like isoform X2 [Dendronephthya gigantea]